MKIAGRFVDDEVIHGWKSWNGWNSVLSHSCVMSVVVSTVPSGPAVLVV
jgi:hypothetical protein